MVSVVSKSHRRRRMSTSLILKVILAVVLLTLMSNITNLFSGTTMSNAASTTPENSPAVVASYCQLKPPWGSEDESSHRRCVGKTPKQPFTTAKELSCPTSFYKPRNQPIENKLMVAIMYYAEPSLLLQQLDHFATLPEEVLQKFQLLIVDDGSPSGLQAQDYILLYPHPLSRQRVIQSTNLRLAQISNNIPWNTPGARNLAFYMAHEQQRVLMIDLDLQIPLSSMRQILELPTRLQSGDDPNAAIAYQFNRTQLDGTYKVHPSATLMDTQAFWNAGGMEEDFSGHYGHEDVAFWYKFDQNPKNQRVVADSVNIIQFDQEPCEGIDPSYYDTCIQARKTLPKLSRDTVPNERKFLSKKTSGCWSNKFLRFPFQVVQGLSLSDAAEKP